MTPTISCAVVSDLSTRSMACAFVTSVPVIAVFFAGQKYFVRGVVLSGLAGR